VNPVCSSLHHLSDVASVVICWTGKDGGADLDHGASPLESSSGEGGFTFCSI